MKTRIYKIIQNEGMTANEFAKTIGFNQSNLSKVLNGKRDVPTNVVSAIMRTFPHKYNIMWLLDGEGDMLNVSSKELNNTSYHKIKYYPSLNSSMGSVVFLDNPDETYFDIVLPGYNDCEYAINAYGDSMYPLIKSGQVVLLSTWRERFFDWGRIYLIVTKSGYRTIKRIFPSENEDCVTCKSENEAVSPAFDIEKNDIVKCFIVKGWVCKDGI